MMQREDTALTAVPRLGFVHASWLYEDARGPEITFTVLGDAKPGGSKKGFVHPATGRAVVVEASNNRAWRQDVALAGREACSEPLEGPLLVVFEFFRERPKGQYGSGRNAGVVKESAPAFPTTRPDVLKLARAAEDALTGIVYWDDAQIVTEVLAKRWGSPARLEVRVVAL